MKDEKVATQEESECPQQIACADFYPTKSKKTCVHFDDEEGECTLEYPEEWDETEEW